MARLILDTGVLVEAYRGHVGSAAIDASASAAVPAVVVAEFVQGILLTRVADDAASQRRFLRSVLDVAPVIDYNELVAEHHAELLAHSRRDGTPRGAHDLMIAATARATGRTVLTTDGRARFDELPGVDARVIEVG